jgi:hypothetical protein
MNLEILSINEHGNAKSEYIILKANVDLDFYDYAILDTTFNKKGGVSNTMRHYFRCKKSHPVKKGEFISVWTRKGVNILGKTMQNNPIHRFYWGSDAAIWNDSSPEVAELLRVQTVEKKKAA